MKPISILHGHNLTSLDVNHRSVNDFFYIGGQMNVENLAGNQFVNFALVAFTEMPSVFIGELMINSIGRRWSQVLCMFVTTIFFAAIMPIANGNNQMSVQKSTL